MEDFLPLMIFNGSRKKQVNLTIPAGNVVPNRAISPLRGPCWNNVV